MRRLGRGEKLLVLLLSYTFLYVPGSRAQSSTAPESVSAEPTAPQKAKNSGSAKGFAQNSTVTDKPASGTQPVEDWNTLAIPNNIQVADPYPPLRATFPEFSREFTQLMWRDWDIIDLYVLKPAGVEKPPVILYLYSFPSDTERFQKDDEFAKLATKNGFAAVGFVSALTGQRFHDRPTKEWFVSELQEALGKSVHDVQLVLNYLATRGDLDMSQVGMFGEGSGGSIAVMAAAVDSRIKVLDLLDPWGDWPDWLAKSSLVPDEERADYLKPEFLKKVENLDPVKWLPTLTTQRVRLQYLKNDTITPVSARERVLAAAPPNTQIVQYDNTRAYIAVVGRLGEKMFDWPKEQLGAPGGRQSSVARDGTKLSDPNKN